MKNMLCSKLCGPCDRRTRDWYGKDRELLCESYSIQGMERVERLGSCPFTIKLEKKKGRVRVGQGKTRQGGNLR